MNYQSKVFAFFFLFLELAEAKVHAQKNIGFVVAGSITGLKNGQKVKLVLEPMYADPEVVLDSTVVNDGTFRMSGFISKGPRRVILRIGSGQNPYERPFMLDNERVRLQVSLGSSVDRYFAQDTSFHVHGGDAENDFNILLGPNVVWNSGLRNLRNYFESLTDSGRYNKQTMEALEREKEIFVAELKKVFQFNLHNRCLPYFYLGLPKFIASDTFFVALYNHLPDNIKKSYYGTLMEKELGGSDGDLAPEFASMSNEGSMISLKQVVSQSKITIVDFWGYSCAPCRMEFRRSLVPLYHQYHEKGLNVIGVSWDDYKSENWRKAIADDHLAWYQVTGQDIFNLYNPGPSPSNVVISKEGRIIAWNVFGVELDWLLDEYLN